MDRYMLNSERDREIEQCLIELTDLARDEMQHRRKDKPIRVRQAKTPKFGSRINTGASRR